MTVKIATKVATLSEGRQALFTLAPPVPTSWWVEEGEEVETTEFVVASRSFHNPREILVFPATAGGEITSWGEIGGSYSEPSFESAIRGMGYGVVAV